MSVTLAAFMQRDTTAAWMPPGSVTIDGRLNEWDLGIDRAGTAIAPGVSTLEEGAVGNAVDASAEIVLGHDAQAIYLGALIQDDHVATEPHGGEMYRSDMLDLVFTQSGLHVGISAHGDAHLFSGAWPKVPKTITCLTTASAHTPTGWSCEARIDKRCLPSGDELTLNLGLRDKDPSEEQTAHLAWSGYRHNLKTSAGTLRLLRESKPKKAQLKPIYGDTLSIDKPLTVSRGALSNGTKDVVLRMVNFQRTTQSWAAFWEGFDEAQTAQDLDLAKSTGANSVRVFLYFESFGAAQPKPEMLARLERFVALCRTRGLLVVVSFFADKKDFRKERYGEMRSQLETVVTRFKSDPAIAMWDLMNEPDHAYASETKTATFAEVAAWVTDMSRVVKAADPTHLLTVGWAGHAATTDFSEETSTLWKQADVISVHGYFPLNTLQKLLERVVALGRPVILQEFGRTRLHVSDDDAARDYKAACQAARKLSGFAAWELFDHPTGTLPHVAGYLETDENHYGLFTARRLPKATAQEFAACLRASRFQLR